MDLYIGSFVVPVSALNLFNTVIILVLIPICDRVIYPCIKRYINHPRPALLPLKYYYMNRCGWNFTMLKKIGVGFLLAALSMVVAGMPLPFPCAQSWWVMSCTLPVVICVLLDSHRGNTSIKTSHRRQVRRSIHLCWCQSTWNGGSQRVLANSSILTHCNSISISDHTAVTCAWPLLVSLINKIGCKWSIREYHRTRVLL